MRLLAIDPGPEESAWVLYDTDTGRPIKWAKESNRSTLSIVLRHSVFSFAREIAVEKIASYGMPVGEDVFRTVWWAGRFAEAWCERMGVVPREVERRNVKLHLCGNTRAKDSNVRQAIIDRYGPGRNVAVGTKAKPGPLHGMRADCWQALAVAITAAETSDTEGGGAS